MCLTPSEAAAQLFARGRHGDVRAGPASITPGSLFADIAHEHGTTFVCATHDPVLIGFADDDLQLRAGAPVPSAE